MRPSIQTVLALAVLLALTAGAAGLTAVADESDAAVENLVSGPQTVGSNQANDTFYFIDDGSLTVLHDQTFAGTFGYAIRQGIDRTVTASFDCAALKEGVVTVNGQEFTIGGGSSDSSIAVVQGSLALVNFTGTLRAENGAFAVTAEGATGLTVSSSGTVSGTLTGGTVKLAGTLSAATLTVNSGQLDVGGTLTVTSALTVAEDGTVAVTGQLEAPHQAGSSAYPVVTSAGTIDATGGTLRIDADRTSSLPQEGILAALYVTDQETFSTGTFTGLKEALAAGAEEIFLLGSQTVTGDLTAAAGQKIYLIRTEDRLTIGDQTAAGHLTISRGADLNLFGQVAVANGWLDLQAVTDGTYDGSVTAEAVRTNGHYTYGSLRALNGIAVSGDTLLLRKSVDLSSQPFALKDGVGLDLGTAHTLTVGNMTVGTGAVYSSDENSRLHVTGHLVYGVPPAALTQWAVNPGSLILEADEQGGVLIQIFRGGNLGVKYGTGNQPVIQWLRTTDGTAEYDYEMVFRRGNADGLPACDLPDIAAPSGYRLTGWYDSPSGGSPVTALGEETGVRIYAVFAQGDESGGGAAPATTATYQFRYAEGAVYHVNGQALTSGALTFAGGTPVTVALTAAAGWSADGAFLHLNGQAGVRTLSFAAAADGVITATGLTADAAGDGGQTGVTLGAGLAWLIIGIVILLGLLLLVVLLLRRRKRRDADA